QESSLDRAEAEALQSIDRHEKGAASVALIWPWLMSSPIGRWALIRKDRALCAVRFSRFHRERPPENRPSSWRDSFFADYDWIYERDGSKGVTANVRSGSGQANRKPNVGGFMHPFSFDVSRDWIDCGPIRVLWVYPNKLLLVERNMNWEKPDRSN